jgi:hypothetical protein
MNIVFFLWSTQGLSVITCVLTNTQWKARLETTPRTGTGTV